MSCGPSQRAPLLPLLTRRCRRSLLLLLLSQRYGRGVERVLSVEGKSSGDIESMVKDLSEGPIAADALHHQEWRTLLDTESSFGLYMQLHGAEGMWEKAKMQDFLGIYVPANNEAGISAEQKATVAAWKALGPELKAEYASPGFKGFCRASSAPRSAMMAQWAALPAAEKACFAAEFAEAEGLRYFRVAADAELSARRRVAGEPDEAEDLFLRGMWEALPAAEREEISARALSGGKMKEYPVVPPFWEQ